MLRDSKIVGFLATSQPDTSKQFYQDTLGLTLVEESPYALVFGSVNAVIRVQVTEQVHAPPYTALGWEVEDIDAITRTLIESGVTPERFDGMAQSDQGIWNAPGGAKIAWFKDPDGNLLSLTQRT